MSKTLTKAELRKRYQGYREIADALCAFVDLGWTVTAQGHGARLLCPCPSRHAWSVSGTPRAGGAQEAKRLRQRVKAECELPDMP